MTGPNAVELQRALAETTRCLKQLTVERYETRYGDKEPRGCCYDAVDAAEKLLADLPPVPEPIKAGDRVRGSYPDWDHIVGVVQYVTAGGNAVVDDRFVGEVLVAVSELGVMSPLDPDYPSPSPEPECECRNPGDICVEGQYVGADPAPSPSLEVGEGHRVPVGPEIGAAYRANVLEGYDEESGTWVPALPWAPWPKRVPSGWGGAS